MGHMRQLDRQMTEAMTAEGKDTSGMGDLPVMPVWINVAPTERMFPLKAGDQLLRIKDADAALYDKEEFTFELAFGEPGVAEGDPLQGMLEQMIKTVAGTLADLKPFLA